MRAQPAHTRRWPTFFEPPATRKAGLLLSGDSTLSVEIARREINCHARTYRYTLKSLAIVQPGMYMYIRTYVGVTELGHLVTKVNCDENTAFPRNRESYGKALKFVA